MTTRVTVGLLRSFAVDGCDDLDGETDALMEALLALEDDTLHSSAVSADFGACTVNLEICAVGPTFDKAIATADAAIRSAIHAVGGHTPDYRPFAQHAEVVPA